MKQQPKLPTLAGERELLNIEAGRRIGSGLVGQAAHGGCYATMRALFRAGLINEDDGLTDAGRAMLKRLRRNQT